MKPIISILSALLILFSTMGFTWSTHICGGKRVKSELAIGKYDVGCGMEKDVASNPCDNSDKMESNCCQNEYLHFQIEDSYLQNDYDKNISFKFVVALVTSYINLYEFSFVKSNYAVYFPPPLVRDIPVLIQSFLI